MTEQQPMTRQFEEAMRSGDMDAGMKFVWDNAADDFIREWPQSGELIRGVENDRAIMDSYEGSTGTAPKYTHGRILGEGNVRVVLGEIDYGDGTPVQMVSIAELRGDKIARMTDYFASPFPAPEWRKKWVEQREPAVAGTR